MTNQKIVIRSATEIEEEKNHFIANIRYRKEKSTISAASWQLATLRHDENEVLFNGDVNMQIAEGRADDFCVHSYGSIQ